MISKQYLWDEESTNTVLLNAFENKSSPLKQIYIYVVVYPGNGMEYYLVIKNKLIIKPWQTWTQVHIIT